jgi:transposase
MAIWQDLVDGHGFAGRYASVKRFVRKLCGSSAPEARVVIETAPGEEAQVDYGTGPMVRDPDSGKYRRTRLFVLTLGHSRKSVRLPGVPFQLAGLGGVAREGVSPIGWRDSRCGAG